LNIAFLATLVRIPPLEALRENPTAPYMVYLAIAATTTILFIQLKALSAARNPWARPAENCGAVSGGED
jgi:hypothetical protein